MQQEPPSIPGQESRRAPLAPKLTTEGIDNLCRVAIATEDPVMRSFWPEIENHIEQNLDHCSDNQLRDLLRIPYWEDVLQRAQPCLSPETRVRIDALRPRSVIGGMLHSIRRKFREWNLPKGVNLADVEFVLSEYEKRLTAVKHPMHNDGYMALMNEVIAERFPDLDEMATRSVRGYFFDQKDLIGAN